MTDQPAPTPPPAGPPAATYPATLSFSLPDRVARWRPLVHWLLAIPHFVVLYVLSIVALIAVIPAWFSGVILGKVPRGLLNFEAMVLRYSASVGAYVNFLHGTYPPFAFAADTTDPGRDPHVRFDVEPQVEGRSRLTIFFRAFMVIPHAVVLYFLGIAAAVVTFIAFFAVIFLGRWPGGMRDFVLGYLRWSQRLSAYYLLLTDEYPPFSLD
jgi:hypothetical protein